MDFHLPKELETPIQIYFQEESMRKQTITSMHNYFEMIFVEDGEADFLINSTTVKMKKGTLVLVSNLDEHKLIVTKPPYKRFFVLIRPECFNSIVTNPMIQSFFKHRGKSYKYYKNIDESIFEKLHSILEKMTEEFQNKEIMWETSLMCQLNYFFVIFFREYNELFNVNEETLCILQIQNYIDANIMENIKLAEVAREFNMSATYLSRAFKETTGISFKEYVIRNRLNKAKAMLATKGDSMDHIAEQSGFNDSNYFIRVFKKYEGITPYQFRKQCFSAKQSRH